MDNNLDMRYTSIAVAKMITEGTVKASSHEIEIAAYQLMLAIEKFAKLTGRDPR